jgi:hypothetical protein
MTEGLRKRATMEKAFNEWKASCLNTAVAECAFNKLLEVNHEHSNARFLGAS